MEGVKNNTVTKEQITEMLSQSKVEVFHAIFGKQCIVVALLPNGFTIVGESACVDPSNYDNKIGYELAMEHIRKQLWMLEGYLLQNRGENID